jgi:hypothetical protein
MPSAACPEPSRRVCRVQSFRQPEIEHLHDTVRAQLDVRGLEIAVHDALFVRGFERLGDLARDGDGFVNRYRTAAQPLRQVFAVDQLHHERRDRPRLFQAVDVGDVWVIQRRQRLGLALEPRQPFGISGERL